MKLSEHKTVILAIGLVILALLSGSVVTRYTSSTKFYAKTIEALEEKTETVMELTAASTAASVAVTLLPGDAGTPIADKLAELGTYFLIVLCAIYLEKYLVTITCYAAFRWLIPAACLLMAGYAVWRKRVFAEIAIKLAIFGTAIALVIPASVTVSELIESTYQSSIEQTLETAKQTTEIIENSTETKETEDTSVSGFFSKIKDGITEAAAGMIEKAEQMLGNFLEALAVMLVTSCIIPVLVVLVFLWLTKMLFGISVTLPAKKS